LLFIIIRPLERLFEEKIKKPLSKHILFGELKFGGKVNVDVVNSEIAIVVLESAQEPVTL